MQILMRDRRGLQTHIRAAATRKTRLRRSDTATARTGAYPVTVAEHAGKAFRRQAPRGRRVS